jgi:hypothetical protein
MSSAWNDSGINWDDLSRTSPRDAIRELYIAVNERDYWVRYFGSGGYATLDELEPIDYNATQRHRTKSQIDFIVNALSNWLSDSSAPTQIVNDLDYAKNGYRGSFIDYSSGSNYEYVNYGNDSDFTTDYYVPNLLGGLRENTLIEEIQLGYDSFNKKEMGNLESQLNIDLSFIRAYDNHRSFRFTYQMMETVFKLLNFLTYTRRCTYRNAGFSGKPAVMAISNFNTAYMIQGNDFAGNSFNEQRDNLYNSVNCNSGQSIIFNPMLTITGYNRDSTIVSPNWTMQYGGSNRACTFNEFNIIGLDGVSFETDFFDHKSAIYNLDLAWDAFAKKSYKTTFFIPTRPLGHTIRNNPFTQLINETDGGSNGDINIDVDPNGTWVENSFGRVVDGEIDDSVENVPSYETSPGGDDAYGKFIEQNMPMINFNKEGFLKYYTE